MFLYFSRMLNKTYKTKYFFRTLATYPYKRTPFGVLMSSLAIFSGYLRGHSTSWRNEVRTFSYPPMSSHFTRDTLPAIDFIADGEIFCIDSSSIDSKETQSFSKITLLLNVIQCISKCWPRFVDDFLDGISAYEQPAHFVFLVWWNIFQVSFIAKIKCVGGHFS